MEAKDTVLFYAEYTDGTGKVHHAIHRYHSTTGIVDMMKDVKDSNCIYPSGDAETWNYEQMHKAYKRYSLLQSKNSPKIQIFDNQEDRYIATFYDIKLANECCEQLNLDNEYNSNEVFDDDM